MIDKRQGQSKSESFRIATLGVLFTPDIDGFLAAFQQVLETAAVRA